MAKMPWVKFFPSDWLLDTRVLNDSEKSAWIDLLCFMWNAPERGKLTGHPKDIARMIGKEWKEFTVILEGLKSKGITNVTDGNDTVTVMSRRMIREENVRESNRIRKREFDKRHGNEEVTDKKLEAKKLEAKKLIKDLETKDLKIAETTPPPPIEQKPKKEPTPYWKDLIDHIDKTWFSKKKSKFYWQKKHFTHLEGIARHYQSWGVMALWDLHLSIQDDYAFKNGYSFESFLLRIPKLIDEPLFKIISEKYDKKLNPGPPEEVKNLIGTIGVGV